MIEFGVMLAILLGVRLVIAVVNGGSGGCLWTVVLVAVLLSVATMIMGGGA